jgi:hypothetical protein
VPLPSMIGPDQSTSTVREKVAIQQSPIRQTSTDDYFLPLAVIAN